MSDTSQGPGWWQASDGKWYPPEQAPGYAAPPPPQAPPLPPPGYGPPPQPGTAYPVGAYVPPASSGMSGCLKAFIIVAVLTVVLGGIGLVLAARAVDDAVDDFDGRDADEVDDVTDLACDTDIGGNLHATFTVENDSSDRSNYVITIAFEAGDTQLDTGTAFVNGLEPGQRTEQQVVSATAAPAGFTCRVSDVERFSDENG